MSYYGILGVSYDASTEEIERAFKQLARALHPDLHGGDGAFEERMKELNVIRTTLTDPALRAAYDVKLHAEQVARATPTFPRRTASRSEELRPERGAAWMDMQAANEFTKSRTYRRPPSAQEIDIAGWLRRPSAVAWIGGATVLLAAVVLTVALLLRSVLEP